MRCFVSFYFLFLSSSSARAGALKERSACAESLEDTCAAQESLLRKKDEALEEASAEAEKLRRELDAQSRRLAKVEEALEAEVATAAASAEAQAAARALESAESSARLGHASAEIETLKVRRRRIEWWFVFGHCRDETWYCGRYHTTKISSEGCFIFCLCIGRGACGRVVVMMAVFGVCCILRLLLCVLGCRYTYCTWRKVELRWSSPNADFLSVLSPCAARLDRGAGV